MKVIWTPEAQQDRIDIWNYIATENPFAAVKIDEIFANSVSKLAEYPKLGQAGKIVGTHELILHKSYRLIYEVEGDVLWILSLVHTAKQWPPIEK